MAHLLDRLLAWLEPEDNPSAVVYGTISVGLLIAAEEPATVGFPKTVLATALALLVYWLAHAYATLLGERFRDRRRPSVWRVAAVLQHEWAITKGAAAPLVVLVLGWATGVSLASTVTTALWVCVGAIVAFEVAAGVRARLPAGEVVAGAAFGAALGAGLLLVKALLH